ncbi:MAG: hypothetical protein E6344_04515 [Clostridium sp.]|nr:hypothetical protein [Clostridium sp.]MDU7082930.1 hypothetical protein [Clostridium sp.]
MISLFELLQEINEEIGIKEVSKLDEIKVAQVMLSKLNSYLYQDNGEYISLYHEYWGRNHAKIIEGCINTDKAKEIAIKFDDIFKNKDKYIGIELSPMIDKNGLRKNDIANVRFFTAIQDFKINIYKAGRDPFQEYHKNPQWFNAQNIKENDSIVNDFLKYLEATGSQGDKREKWMKTAAVFLIENYNGDAYNIYEQCNNDVLKVREVLADNAEIGYSRKKADMLIRDMLDWGVWEPEKNVEQLNVASDSNTMRVALRTSLLETKIPLLASYLDVYCYQYGLMDRLTQEAWRTVWNEWKQLPDNAAPPAPASMDYLIYKSIGKNNCKKNKTKCSTCVMNEICPLDKRNLNPPKSISIYGMTGWESGRTNKGGGGGIMA